MSLRRLSRLMRAIRRVALVMALALVVAAGWLAAVALVSEYPVHPRAVSHDPRVWRGAYHIHTTASRDGHGDVADVVRAARAAGLAWVLITDHNLVELPLPGYHQGVLVIQAVESSTIHGHLVMLGATRGLHRSERRGPAPLAVARTLDGALVAAHPLNRRRPFRRMDDPSIVGMEVLSLDDAFRETMRLPLRLLHVGWTYAFNEVHAVFNLVHAPHAALSRWDELLAARRVAGYGALDAHGRPPYDGPMKTLSMHAQVGHGMTGDARVDAVALTDALVAGRSFICVEAFAPGSGFHFGARTSSDDAEQQIGGEVLLAQRPQVEVDLGPSPPPGIETRIVCGGRTVARAESGVASPLAYRPKAAGACRVEVWSEHGGRSRPWILSNPIYVR